LRASICLLVDRARPRGDDQQDAVRGAGSTAEEAIMGKPAAEYDAGDNTCPKCGRNLLRGTEIDTWLCPDKDCGWTVGTLPPEPPRTWRPKWID
jgi:hypothetical protein